MNLILLFGVWNLVHLTAFSDVIFHKYFFSMNPYKNWYSQHYLCKIENEKYKNIWHKQMKYQILLKRI